ncbi:MAG: exo-alpha-sialidase [Planctomycetota bacterium]|nr:MAG: exo-alpha-sialidase [Planctomycetota bacterium]
MRKYALLVLLMFSGLVGCNALISNPDFVVFVPPGAGSSEGTNQHFLVVPTVKRTFLAFWTQAFHENDPDQRVVMSRSTDRGRNWSKPVLLAGDPSGKSGRRASWQFPVVVPHSGRVYLFWNQNVGVVDARADTTGVLAYRWSDDDGLAWSEVHTLPIRKSAISHPDPDVPENWVVYQCPIITPGGDVMVGFTRWASRKVQPEGGLFERDSEIWFLRFDNILSEPDPTKLRVTTLPDGEHGIRVPCPDIPAISVAQEPTFQQLSDGRLICVMRTRTGFIYYALSADSGHSWCKAQPLRYTPDGPKVPQPLASCPLYKLKDGRFVLVFHNNSGYANGGIGPTDSKRNRRPVFLAVGREIEHLQHPVMFTRPRMIADNRGISTGPSQHTQIGTYPSLFEFEGQVYFWYPDRKHYLLGKLLSPQILDDSGLPR